MIWLNMMVAMDANMNLTAFDAPCKDCRRSHIDGDYPDNYEPADDNINHPSHYCQDGGVECIDEMIAVFGVEAVQNFCLLNVWKYRKRALFKNGEEDLKKSDWYMKKWMELKEGGDGMRLIDADALDYELGASDRDIYVRECLAEAPSVVVEPRWIPVTERLPDDSRNVLITSRGGVSMAWYNGSYFEKGANTHHRKMQTVTAWCELPEPYKGVTE